MRQGPLAGRYPALAAMVMCALIPYLALSGALGPLTPIIATQLHASLQTMSLSSGLGNAAYAVGTILAVQFAQHLPPRRMMLAYAALLLVGSVLAAAAQDPTMFIVGHVVQGLCTSLLLIAAVPPLAIGFPQAKLRITLVILNMCIFGAVALGPFIGGLQAQSHAWRPLFWIVAAVAAVALVLCVLTFEDLPPANPDSPRDLPAIGLAAVGCVAAFFGASELTSHRFLDTETLLPLLGGLATIIALVVYQYRAKRPLLTIRTMLTSSIPVAGIAVALFAAAASVSATVLTESVLAARYSPLHIGLLYLPEVGGAVVTALALGAVMKKRSLHYLPLVGMIALAAGIVVFRIEVPSSQALTLVGSGLTGIGLGGTVAPALFVAGFSLNAANLQRVFAIVELLRAVAAFMVAPIFVYFASTASGGLDAGTATALWVGLGLAVAGAAIGIAIYALSGARPQAPDLERFLANEGPAWYSPPLLAKVRAGLSNVNPAPEEPSEVTDVLSMTGTAPSDIVTPVGPVLFAYDGSELAALAIDGAGTQLAGGRDALVVCVWQPAYVGFSPVDKHHFDAADAIEVHRAAEETAAYGASLAENAGFRAQSMAVEAEPTWKGIVQTANDSNASVIVIGSHRHSGLVGHLVGSVAAAVITHAGSPVLVVHQGPRETDRHLEQGPPSLDVEEDSGQVPEVGSSSPRVAIFQSNQRPE
jgi:nucleotide-binding universal stress UspA family protein/MFS family permease